MRIDIFLHENGFCDSRNRAKMLIQSGRVKANGKLVEKVSYDVSNGDEVEISASDVMEFVGRGGIKLEHAITCFNIDAAGKVCADIGASTGGFTECLLMHGAAKVYAVDSGTGQLAAKLRSDNRVVSLEGVNARFISPETFGGNKVNLVVMDVSFISQTLLYPAILSVAEPSSDVITLIKPQFEAGKRNVGKHGIVKDEKVRLGVVKDIISFAQNAGFEYVSNIQSPITGGSGNIEYLLHLRIK